MTAWLDSKILLLRLRRHRTWSRRHAGKRRSRVRRGASGVGGGGRGLARGAPTKQEVGFHTKRQLGLRFFDPDGTRQWFYQPELWFKGRVTPVLLSLISYALTAMDRK